MLFVKVMQIYTGVYLYKTIFVIDIQRLIILVRNNIFQRNLAVTSGIYFGLSVRNSIQIR